MPEKLRKTSIEAVETSIPRMNIFRGLDDSFAKQLVRSSRQEAVAKFCPKDATERFASLDAAMERAQQPDREMYILTPAKRLAGLIWYGEKPNPFSQAVVDASVLPHHTFAIRMYESYGGRGLARPFMRDSLHDYLGLLDFRGRLKDFQGLWLSTNPSNTLARTLYHRFGYKEVGFAENSEGTSDLIMALSRDAAFEQALGIG